VLCIRHNTDCSSEQRIGDNKGRNKDSSTPEVRESCYAESFDVVRYSACWERWWHPTSLGRVAHVCKIEVTIARPRDTRMHTTQHERISADGWEGGQDRGRLV